MPTYEYVCETCGHTFEQIQSISAKALTICPKEACAKKKWGKGKVRRAISAGAGLLFKGSGFYITDYRSENYKQAAKKESTPAAASADAKTASTGSDKPSTPAKKTETKAAAPAKPKSD